MYVTGRNVLLSFASLSRSWRSRVNFNEYGGRSTTVSPLLHTVCRVKRIALQHNSYNMRVV